MEPYAYNLEEEDIKRERRKARELRASEWWKRKLSKRSEEHTSELQSQVYISRMPSSA